MNNEPVAWIDWECSHVVFDKPSSMEHFEPLYTHPAKTLTDEEIIEIWSGMETDTGEQNIDFARAILKRAFEK